MAERRDVLTRPAPAPDLTLRYGPGPEQVADVWLPSRPGRLVLALHGGYWRVEHDRGYFGSLAADLAGRGWVVAAVEYRRTGAGAGAGGGWPNTFLDVAVAMDLLPGLVAEVAPDLVAPGPPYYLGHSAGGQLVLWSAVRHLLPAGAPGRRDGPPAVAGIIALAPVCGVAEAYRRYLDLGAADVLLGGGPADVPERYAAVDPAALPAPETTTVLLHGSSDGRVPVVLSREYAADHHVRLVEVDGADHFALVDPQSSAWSSVLSELAGLDRAGVRY